MTTRQLEMRRPGTATAAAVLAIIGSVRMLAIFIDGVITDTSVVPEGVIRNGVQMIALVQVVGAAFSLLLLLGGGVLLLKRAAPGRAMVVAGCVVHVISWLVILQLTRSWIESVLAETGVAVDAAEISSTTTLWKVLLILPAITVLLAVAPATTRWLNGVNETHHVPASSMSK